MDECITSTRVSNKSNIVSTYDIVRENDDHTIIIVMEYIDGISLRKYIEEQNSINVKEAVYLFGLILNGIKELHGFRDKIIHRDLKPENVLLTKDLLNLKIIDFGISSVVATTVGDTSQQIQTNENVPFGTYPYICPDFIKMCESINKLKQNKTTEQSGLVMSKYITEQFDFFSLGVIFYEILTGEKPFFATDYNKAEVVRLPLKYDIMCMNDINPNIPPLIENIIFRCLASKPEDIKYRYTNVNQIIEDLEKYNKDPKMAMVVPLLKPKNKRTLQLKGIFNIEGQKAKEKIYEKTWFYIVIAGFVCLVAIVTILLGYLHELKG
jgi:serine/threonine-protein kinase